MVEGIIDTPAEDEETLRKELEALRRGVAERIEEEARAQRERRSVKAAGIAAQQATLQRDLLTLQRQLVFPELTLMGSGDSSESIWTALIANDMAMSLSPGFWDDDCKMRSELDVNEVNKSTQWMRTGRFSL